MSRHRDYRNRTYSYDEVEVEVERRLDEDGTPYTRDEFIDFYGGTVEWLAAPPYFPPDAKKKKNKKSKKKNKKGKNPDAPANTEDNTGSAQGNAATAAAAATATASSESGGAGGGGGGNSEAVNPLAKLIAGTVRVTKSDAPAATIVGGGGDEFAATMSATTGGQQPSAKLLEAVDVGGIDAPSGDFDFSQPSPDDVALRKRQGLGRGGGGGSGGGQQHNKPTAPSAAGAGGGAKTPQQKKIAEEVPEEGVLPHINLVVVGHVDAGKSTLMGHLLLKLDFVSKQTLQKYKKQSETAGKGSFAFAWVMDEHETERERGVTIDVGVTHFTTDHRRLTLLDAPGHRDFIPNMITGASQADAAILVVPCKHGEFEKAFSPMGQTKEHAVLVFSFGVTHLVVAVNKIDTVDWDRERYDSVVAEVLGFLLKVGFKRENVVFVPVSGFRGDNLVPASDRGAGNANTGKRGDKVPAEGDWYYDGSHAGISLLEAIDQLPPPEHNLNAPCRMTIADTYRGKKDSCVVAGKLEAGCLRPGDDVIIMPSEVVCKVKNVNVNGHSVKRAVAGSNIDVSFTDVAFGQASTGSVLSSYPDAPAPVVKRFRGRIRTLPAMDVPMLKRMNYTLHIHNYVGQCDVSKLNKLLDGVAVAIQRQKEKEAKIAAANDGNGAAALPPPAKPRRPRRITANSTAVIEIEAELPVCCERFADLAPLGRFLLRDKGVTVAVGKILKILEVKPSILDR